MCFIVASGFACLYRNKKARQALLWLVDQETSAHRKNVRGVLQFGAQLLWNIEV